MKKFGLLGERLGHSFSPQIHALLADYEYALYEVSPGGLAGFLDDADFDGLNVTIPYKKAVLPFCESLSDNAERIGSVNTIVRREDGSLFGDNTDYFGFSYLLGRLGVCVKGKKALVLGNGGAAAAVRAVLGDQGLCDIVTISRSGPDNYDNIEKHADAQIIINTTPVGMYPGNGASPVSLGLFSSCEAVLDVIYNPAKTELMLQAEDLGIMCAGGLDMLVAQAKRACDLFSGSDGPDDAIGGISDIMGHKMRNIALIGMPGCGKTAVGKRIAEMTGREFFDSDEVIEAKAGKSIKRIFADDGEDVFRDMEADTLGELLKLSGCLIATGGGIVKREINRRFLRQNSVAVFLDRAPDELPLDGRPLSLSTGIETLYSERLPLYIEWCDFRITALSGVEETAGAVVEGLE